MSLHLDVAIQKLKKTLLGMAAFVEEQVKTSLSALTQRSDSLARSVIQKDAQIDQMEVDIEEECLKILALYQPVALDLRFVVAVLKINNDLERIGDLAVNIAERAITLTQNLPAASLDFSAMTNKTLLMLKESIDSFISGDVELARKVCRADTEIDQEHAENYGKVDQMILEHPEHSSSIIQNLSISRYLERVADLATNIAEDVIYLVDGKIVRRQERRGVSGSHS